MQNYIDYDTEKLYIYGAMELYLDFINIFIRLLSILGRNTRRD
jgi:FtsH-binding integral membrane protein